MLLEYSDIKPFIAQIISDARKQLESEVFLSYPEGMQKHLTDGEVSRKTYQRVRKIYLKKDFPRCEKEGIKGVYLNDLKEYLRI